MSDHDDALFELADVVLCPPGAVHSALELNAAARGPIRRRRRHRDHHIDPGAQFSENPDFQNSFPVHCVVGSEGGEFHPHFAPAVGSGHIDEVFFKGAHSVSKSGFEGFTQDGRHCPPG